MWWAISALATIHGNKSPTSVGHKRRCWSLFLIHRFLCFCPCLCLCLARPCLCMCVCVCHYPSLLLCVYFCLSVFYAYVFVPMHECLSAYVCMCFDACAFLI